MWIYEQATGLLRQQDLNDAVQVIGQGYAGHGAGVNNPALQTVADVGPLPCGFYTIGAPCDDPHTGPLSMHLTPNSRNQMFGRSAFLLHGDSVAHPGTASEGCIVMPRPVRVFVSESADRLLLVVRSYDETARAA